MKLFLLYNPYALIHFSLVIFLSCGRYNCEESEKKQENCLGVVFSSRKKAFISEPKTKKVKNVYKSLFTSHNRIPWHVESNSYGEVIVPDNYHIKSPFVKNNSKMYYKNLRIFDYPNVVKRSFVSNISEEINIPAKSIDQSDSPFQEMSSLVPISVLQSTEQTIYPKDLNPIANLNSEESKTDFSNPETILRNLNALIQNSNIDTMPTLSLSSNNSRIDSSLSSNNSGLLKQDCESLHHRSCVCSFKETLLDFEHILTKNPEKKVQSVDIVNYKCKYFLPVPENFELSSGMKPKVLSKSKGLVIDDGKGPKEINQRSIEDLLSYGLEDEGTVIYAFPNTNLVLPCFPSEDIHLSGHNDNTNYTWRHGDDKVITEGRITTDIIHKGRLTINDLSVHDSDNYTCSVTYVNPDTGHYTSEKFVHSVTVVSLPIIVLQAVIHYKAALKCDESILEMFELYLPQQLEQALCSIDEGKCICDINIYHPVCHTGNTARNERDLDYLESNGYFSYWQRLKRQTGEDSMEMSLNLEVQVHRISDLLLSAKNTSQCNPLCQQKVNLKLAQMIRDSFPDVLPVKVTSNLGATFEPILNSIMMKYVVGCHGGYELTDGFCTPCKENHFSEDGDTGCSTCPTGTYQNHVGARSCIECRTHWIPTCNEFTEAYNMEILLIVIGIISFLFVGFCLLYVFFIREKDNQGQGLISPTFTHKTRKPRGKLAKSGRYQRVRVIPASEETIDNALTDDSEESYDTHL